MRGAPSVDGVQPRVSVLGMSGATNQTQQKHSCQTLVRGEKSHNNTTTLGCCGGIFKVTHVWQVSFHLCGMSMRFCHALFALR